MKKILLLAVVCCTLMVAQAQRVYFIYMQSDNGSPFYLKTGDKVYSSSAHGYLIVPKLADSTYNVVIGKPGLAESRFTIPVNGKDHGFLLRQNGQQLSLFNLQTMALLEAAAGNNGSVSYIDKTDRFTTLLSKAADDSTLLKMAVFAKVEKAPEPAKTVAKVEAPVKEEKAASELAAGDAVAETTTATNTATADTTAIAATVKKEAEKEEGNKQEEAKTETAKTEVAKEVLVKEEVKAEPAPVETGAPVAEQSVYKRSIVQRRSESSTSEGFGLMFTDNVDGVVDTIRLVIPNPRTIFRDNDVAKEKATKEENRFLELEKTTEKTEAEAGNEEEPQKRKGLFGFKKQGTAEEKVAAKDKQEEEKTEAPAQKRNGLFGSKKQADEKGENATADTKKKQPEKAVATQPEETCRNMASSNDFARLRRNMVGKSSEDEMVGEAQKAFKSNCFTTQQIKTLSSLLLTSDGRYNLFAAAYKHVSDKENFRSLQNELWDRRDIDRFKALLAQ